MSSEMITTVKEINRLTISPSCVGRTLSKLPAHEAAIIISLLLHIRSLDLFILLNNSLYLQPTSAYLPFIPILQPLLCSLAYVFNLLWILHI